MMRDDFVPMDNPRRIPVNMRLRPDHYEKLMTGLKPEMMEDKWLIYVENDIIHCHRSWTGYETYRAQMRKDDDGCYVITEILAERNAAKYTNTNDDKDIMSFSRVIAWLVLETGVEEIMSGKEFIRCSKGHVYDFKLKKCPYCDGLTINEELEKLPDNDKENDIVKNLGNIAMCYLMGPKE